jgi:hypothetical protein
VARRLDSEISCDRHRGVIADRTMTTGLTEADMASTETDDLITQAKRLAEHVRVAIGAARITAAESKQIIVRARYAIDRARAHYPVDPTAKSADVCDVDLVKVGPYRRKA